MCKFSQRFRCVAVTTLCGACLTNFSGCNRRTGPLRIAISGEVLLDGEPLESGRIQFTPVDETNGPAAVTTVIDGIYVFDPTNGPVVGKNKIQIESLPDPGFELDDEAAYAQAIRKSKGKNVMPPDVIPPRYNARTELFATISPHAETEFDFALKKSTSVPRR
jgi:hypothetical protein